MKSAMEVRRAVCALPRIALAMLLFDLPFRKIALLGLAPVAGPKNMLPVLFGLLYGPAGALGSALGVLLSALVRLRMTADCAAEAVGALAAGCIVWAIWYRLPGLRRPSCKTAREMAGVLFCIAAASVATGVCMLAVPEKTLGVRACALALEMGMSTAAWSLLLGMPCLIMATSMFGIRPVAPDGWARQHREDDKPDFERTVVNDPASIGELCSEVDLFSMTHGLPPKLAYAVMSCVEEMSCLILEHLPAGGSVQVMLTKGDSMLLLLRYAGEKYNPMAGHIRPQELTADAECWSILGTLIVREMAVHIRHGYAQGVNEVKIII